MKYWCNKDFYRMLPIIAWTLLFIIKTRFPASRSIAEILIQRYGEAELHTYRTLERTDFKLQKSKADLDFLNTCKDNNLVPKFLNFKPYSTKVKSSEAYRTAQRIFLNHEIKDKEKRVSSLEKQRRDLQSQVRSSVSFITYVHLENLIEKTNSLKILRIKAVHAKKLGRIGYSVIEELSPDEVLFNFSSRTLTSAEKSLLSKGLKFALPPKQLTAERYLYTFEKLFESLSKHTIYNNTNNKLESFRDKLRHLVKSSFQRFKKHQPKPVLSEEETKALESLSKDKSIVIARPDKGNGVVLMDKEDYISRVNAILSDTSKFVKLDSDTDALLTVLHLEDKIHTFLQKQFDEINERGKRGPTYNYLYPSGTNLGILYGLPKIHKENYPLRPILSACNTPNYMLAKFLVPNLTPLTKNTYTVHDSFKFAKEICEIDSKGLVMASFDVVSLFTNIPLQETIDIILFELFDNPDNIESLTISEDGTKFVECHVPDKPDQVSLFNRDNFRKLLELATLDSHFFFNKNIYKQVDGVAMGSPLGPHLANIFMSHMEKKWLQDCPDYFKPVLYRRYVDDTFLLFKSDQHVNLFLTYLNSKHPSINFTSDQEHNQILPFLDVKVQRLEDKFITSIYRKPTFTGLLSKYYAFSPKENKENLVYTLTVRAYKICSDFLSFHNEIERLKSILKSNGYPLKFIEGCIGKMLAKLHKPTPHIETLDYNVPKAEIYFSTYFLGDVSKSIEKELKQIVSESYPQIQLLFTYKSSSMIGSHFRFKDTQPLMSKSNLIYKYTCECCKAFYIGMTTRQLAIRISEHSGVSARTGKNFKKKLPHQMFMTTVKNSVTPMLNLKISKFLTPSHLKMDFIF